MADFLFNQYDDVEIPLNGSIAIKMNHVSIKLIDCLYFQIKQNELNTKFRQNFKKKLCNINFFVITLLLLQLAIIILSPIELGTYPCKSTTDG
jgi:hypothetical protein